MNFATIWNQYKLTGPESVKTKIYWSKNNEIITSNPLLNRDSYSCYYKLFKLKSTYAFKLCLTNIDDISEKGDFDGKFVLIYIEISHPLNFILNMYVDKKSLIKITKWKGNISFYTSVDILQNIMYDNSKEL